MKPKPIEPDKDSLVTRIRSILSDKMDKIKDAITYSIKKYNLDGSSNFQLAYEGAENDRSIYQSMELGTESATGNYMMGPQCRCNRCNRCNCNCNCNQCCNQCRYD